MQNGEAILDIAKHYVPKSTVTSLFRRVQVGAFGLMSNFGTLLYGEVWLFPTFCY